METIKKYIKENLITEEGDINFRVYRSHSNFINENIIKTTQFLSLYHRKVLTVQRIWHILNNDYKIHYCIGNNPVSFISLKEGYKHHCKDKKCTCNSDTLIKTKKSNLEKYGVENVFQLESSKIKTKKTNLERYGVEHPAHSETFVNKRLQTNLEKYGAKYPLQSTEIRDKFSNTMVEKYGVKHALQSTELQDKKTETNINKFGVEHSLQSKIIMNKLKATNLEKYGYENSLQNTIVKNKAISTIQKNYGVDNPAKSDIIKEKIKNTNLERYGTKSHAQKHIHDIINLIEQPTFWEQFTSYNEIFNFFKDRVVESTIRLYTHRYRPDLISKGNISYPHSVINEFLTSLNIEYQINTRSVISPSELDIYIPVYNLAIEINGVYWHTESQGKDKNYHLNKVNKCEEKDIKLLHLTDIDILTKQDIVFNLIKEKLNLNEVIDINECIIIDLDKETVINFIKENSLHEYRESNIHKGLLYDNKLISIICLKELNNQFEITNYTTKLGYNIKNELQQLLKNIKSDFIINVDRRFSNGKFYLDNNFKLINISEPEYYFTKDYSTFFHSLNFDKSILNEYDSKLSVYDNIIQNGYNLIWDCGYKIYSFSNY